MKKYLLSIYQPEGDPPPPEMLEPIMQDVEALGREMEEAGACVFVAGLHPPSRSTVVRVQNGRVLTTDGPFIESKEFIGGFWVVEVPDDDAALDWARKAAQATTLPIEVRPFQGEGV